MESKEHEQGVAAAEKYIKEQGFKVKELINVGDHCPDVYAVKDLGNDTVQKAIIEVETSDSLSDDQSKEQMIDFATWGKQYTARRVILFIPKGIKDEAKKELPSYKEYIEF